MRRDASMHLFNRSAKKTEISRLLEIEDPVNTAKIENSAVARAAFTPMPKSLLNLTLYSIVTLGVFFTCILLVLAGVTKDAYPTVIFGGVLGLLALVAFFAVVVNAAEDKKVVTEYLREALQELQSLHSHLSSYIETVDKRTNRFFHCVTTSKVTTYYLLNQMEDELEKAINQLGEFSEKNTTPAIENSLNLLKGNVRVTDGLVAEAGQSHDIAFHNLKVVLSELEEKMESGIKEIESEIISFRNPAGANQPQDPEEQL